jgi:hypothetical protein
MNYQNQAEEIERTPDHCQQHVSNVWNMNIIVPSYPEVWLFAIER